MVEIQHNCFSVRSIIIFFLDKLSKKHHQIKVFLQFFFSSNSKFLFTKYYQALTFVKSLKGTKSEMAETLTLYSNWIVAFMDWV